MAGGLAALLDDIAAMARLAAASTDDIAAGAAKASSKSAAVVVDDAAVTPQFLEGSEPNRELPMIWRIAKGSLRNKAIIVPAALLLSVVAPWLLMPLLMIGGTYLCYEGAEKIWEKITGHGEEGMSDSERSDEDEDSVVSSAITTDFVLSCEILVIALETVAHQPLLNRSLIMVVVALAMTALVYGVVALIVKMDDVGLHLAREKSGGAASFGKGLVKAMPKVLALISFVGMLAMLWVGGHLMLRGADELGWHAPYALVHHLAEPAHHLPGVGAAAAWLVDTFASMVVGLAWGAVVLAVLHLLPFRSHSHGGHLPPTHERRARLREAGMAFGGAEDGATGSHRAEPTE